MTRSQIKIKTLSKRNKASNREINQQPNQAFKPTVISTPRPLLRSRSCNDIESCFLSPINRPGSSKANVRTTRASNSKFSKESLKIKNEPDESYLYAVQEENENDQSTPQLVIEESNASQVRQSLSIMTINSVEDIFSNAADFNSENSETDSMWDFNPFDRIKFRRRNQSLENTITQAGAERPKRGRPQPDQDVFNQEPSQNDPVTSKIKNPPRKPTRKPKVQKVKAPSKKCPEKLPQEIEPNETHKVKTIQVLKGTKRKAEPQKTPPKLSRKRKPVSEDREDPSKNSKTPISSSRDEGFNTDESAELDTDFDVKYVPENSRYPLRKRRYLRAWWINSGQKNLRYEHTEYTSADIKNEKAIKIIKKESKIPTKSIIGNTIVQNPPAVMLKIAKELQKEKKRLTSNQSKKKSIESNQSKRKSGNSSNSSKEIAEAFELRSGEKGVHTVEQHKGFDMVEIEKIQWELISDGVFSNQLIPGANDEIIKIQPGATKQTALTSSNLKCHVLCGEVTFNINGKSKEFKYFAFVSIVSGIQYEITNTGDHDAIIIFTAP